MYFTPKMAGHIYQRKIQFVPRIKVIEKKKTQRPIKIIFELYPFLLFCTILYLVILFCTGWKLLSSLQIEKWGFLLLPVSKTVVNVHYSTDHSASHLYLFIQHCGPLKAKISITKIVAFFISVS